MPSDIPTMSHMTNAPIASQKVTGAARVISDITYSWRVNE